MSRRLWWAAAALTLLSLLPLALVEHPPLQDYPYHLARANVLASWDDPELDYPATFTISLYPTPYFLADVLLAGLGRVVTMEWAGKVLLGAYLVALPWSLFWLLGSLDPRKAPLGFAGFLLAPTRAFHMGFVSYVLSIPTALFAIGWWWRTREEPAGRRLAGLVPAVLATYLFHVYGFGILACVLFVLALLVRPRRRQLVTTALAFVPPVLLALPLVLGRLFGGGGESQAWILQYGGVVRKLLEVAGSLPSFHLVWETVLFALAGLLVLALAFRGIRRGAGGPERRFLWVVLGLVVLYLALPEQVGESLNVSNRVPPFLVLLGLTLAVVPRGRGPALVAGALAGLSLLHLGGLALAYQEAERDLQPYERALERLPPDARVQFRAHRPSMRMGRVAPAAFFGGYHYLESPGDRIPDLHTFVDYLRPVEYRRTDDDTLTMAAVQDRDRLARLLTRPWRVGVGGGVVVLAPDPELHLPEVAGAYGYRPLVRSGAVEVWLKTRHVPLRDEPGEDDFVTGWQDDPEWVVVFRDEPPAAPPAPGFVLEWSEEPVYLFRRAGPGLSARRALR